MMPRKILKKYSSKSYWKNKTVLITGINGFIGSNLSKLLLSLGAKIIGIANDKKKNSLLEYKEKKKDIKIHYLDLSDYKKLDTTIKNYQILNTIKYY